MRSRWHTLHLGVTEAGDGDDARIKSAIGIGSLLYDGLGDTIRVSLTEDPVAEVPVAKALAEKASMLWRDNAPEVPMDPVDPFSYTRRDVGKTTIGNSLKVGPLEPPLVIQPGPPPAAIGSPDGYAKALNDAQSALREARIEGLMLRAEDSAPLGLNQMREAIGDTVGFLVWDLSGLPLDEETVNRLSSGSRPGDIWLTDFTSRADWIELLTLSELAGVRMALGISPNRLPELFPGDLESGGLQAIVTLPTGLDASTTAHPLGLYRQLAGNLSLISADNPIWIRNTPATAIDKIQEHFGDRLLEASMLSGSLICDGIGDIISVETVPAIRQSTTLSYNILQGARARTTKTEYVACPSCGRTLFDLQTTTQKIRAATGHLKGVTIAVMGCIVNGPGEMADADFGYVGGAPGKVNLYVGKKCVRFHIPAKEAVEALIDLIREHGKWQDPPADA